MFNRYTQKFRTCVLICLSLLSIEKDFTINRTTLSYMIVCRSWCDVQPLFLITETLCFARQHNNNNPLVFHRYSTSTSPKTASTHTCKKTKSAFRTTNQYQLTLQCSILPARTLPNQRKSMNIYLFKKTMWGHIWKSFLIKTKVVHSPTNETKQNAGIRFPRSLTR